MPNQYHKDVKNDAGKMASFFHIFFRENFPDIP